MCLLFGCFCGGRVFFLLFGRGGVFLFLLFGRGHVFFFLLFGRVRVLFLLFGPGGVFFILLFGRGTGVHSLTRLPGASLSDPTTKENEQQKKKTRVPLNCPPRTKKATANINKNTRGRISLQHQDSLSWNLHKALLNKGEEFFCVG